jgi:filamentous hemagglutinin
MPEDSRSIHSHALPGYDRAEVPRNKLEGYSLNPVHDKGKHKARVFQSALGFSQGDWQELKKRILDELPYYEAVPRGQGQWGIKYVVVLPVVGLNGNIVNVETVWIIRPGTDFPSLVTALVEK